MTYSGGDIDAPRDGDDDLSRQNDRVDRMARATVDDTVVVVPETPAEDVVFAGCPLRLLGPPVSQSAVVAWVRANLTALDADLVDKHLMKALAELCKTRNVNLTKQTIQKSAMIRAERMSLQITRVDTETTE